MLRLVKKKDNFKNLRRRIKDLARHNVKVGYFSEQGLHDTERETTGERLTYTQLAAIHFGGSIKNNIPARPVLDIAVALEPLRNNKELKTLLKRYFSSIDKLRAPIKATIVLEKIGGIFVDTGRDIFGDNTYLTKLEPATIKQKEKRGAKYTTEPLMEWGSLRNNLSFRIDNGVIMTPYKS